MQYRLRYHKVEAGNPAEEMHIHGSVHGRTEVSVPLPVMYRAQLRAWADRWLPESVRMADPDTLRRGRLLISFTVATASWGAALALAFLLLGREEVCLALTAATALLMLSPVLLRITSSITVAGTWFCLHLYWPVTAWMLWSGNLDWAASGWLAAVPVVGALLVGRKTAYALAALSIGTSGAAWYDPASTVSATEASLLAVGLTGLLFSLAMLYRSASDSALRQLHAAVTQLRDEVERHRRTRITLEEVHRELVEQARIAGRAEIATNVLHNVGNTLTWVNLTGEAMRGNLRDSRIPRLRKAVALLQALAAEHETFRRDPRGSKLTTYLDQLSLHLAAEREELTQDVEKLTSGLDHISATVRMQQAHARCALVEEEVRVDQAIDEAIRYSDASTPRGDLIVEQEVERLPPVMIDKHRLVQILVNLIENAKRAAGTGDSDRPRVMLQAREEPRGRLRFVVTDNGIGIPRKDLPRVFRHGYTTTTDGHGFGLHASVLAARDLGGTLHCVSDGLGTGATFTLDVPMRASWPDVADPTEEQKTVKAQAPGMPV